MPSASKGEESGGNPAKTAVTTPLVGPLAWQTTRIGGWDRFCSLSKEERAKAIDHISVDYLTESVWTDKIVKDTFGTVVLCWPDPAGGGRTDLPAEQWIALIHAVADLCPKVESVKLEPLHVDIRRTSSSSPPTRPSERPDGWTDMRVKLVWEDGRYERIGPVKRLGKCGLEVFIPGRLTE